MEVLPIIGLGLVAAVLAVVLRAYKPEYAMLLSLGAGVLILLMIVGELGPVLAQITDMLGTASIPGEYGAVLFKALGLCFITQIACDTCKDAGESAIAGKIEMAGRVAVLVVSLPLFNQVLSIVYSLIM